MRVGIDVEIHVFRRHDLQEDDDIVEERAVLRHPALALVIGHAVGAFDREVVGDVLLIRRGDSFDGLPAARSYLESQVIHVAIVVHVDHGIALSLDSHIRIVFLQAEAGVLIISVVDPGVVVVVGASDVQCDRRADGGVFDSDRFSKVVSVTVQILLPNQDCIVGGGFGVPLGIDGDGFRQLPTFEELEFVAICTVFVSIPAAEGIPEAAHPCRSVSNRFVRLDEAGGDVRGALAVLIEGQPVAGGSVDDELDVAADVDRIVVLIDLVRYIAADVAAALIDLPALEV